VTSCSPPRRMSDQPQVRHPVSRDTQHPMLLLESRCPTDKVDDFLRRIRENFIFRASAQTARCLQIAPVIQFPHRKILYSILLILDNISRRTVSPAVLLAVFRAILYSHAAVLRTFARQNDRGQTHNSLRELCRFRVRCQPKFSTLLTVRFSHFRTVFVPLLLLKIRCPAVAHLL
jgi:hypothetical protein